MPAVFADDTRLDHELLLDFDFNPEVCLGQMAMVRQRELDASSAVVTECIDRVEEIPEVRYDGSSDERAAYDAGAEALAKGEVAVFVLNGGLATRFGGVVKGIVEVFDGKSFLGLKAEDVARTQREFGVDIPLVIMNSFATRRDTDAHLRANNFFGIKPENLLTFDQSISVRLTDNGEVFIGNDNRARYYAPGHGEFFQRIHDSGAYAELASRKIRHLTFSNIDNLGASIDPLIIGKHILSRKDITVEVIRKTRNARGEWDVGGAPAKIGNRTMVIEGFRFPASIPPDFLPDFQTNNMYFSMDALRDPFVLPRYYVTKQVEGRASVSFEAVTCEATGATKADGSPWYSTNLVRVPRQGPHGRFFPVKSREDLETERGAIKSRVFEGWRSRQGTGRSNY